MKKIGQRQDERPEIVEVMREFDRQLEKHAQHVTGASVQKCFAAYNVQARENNFMHAEDIFSHQLRIECIMEKLEETARNAALTNKMASDSPNTVTRASSQML